MNTYPISLNTNLANIYDNAGKPHLFRVRVNVMLFVLKDQLIQINSRLNHKDTRGWTMLSITIHGPTKLETTGHPYEAHK